MNKTNSIIDFKIDKTTRRQPATNQNVHETEWSEAHRRAPTAHTNTWITLEYWRINNAFDITCATSSIKLARTFSMMPSLVFLAVEKRKGGGWVCCQGVLSNGVLSLSNACERCTSVNMCRASAMSCDVGWCPVVDDNCVNNKWTSRLYSSLAWGSSAARHYQTKLKFIVFLEYNLKINDLLYNQLMYHEQFLLWQHVTQL